MGGNRAPRGTSVPGILAAIAMAAPSPAGDARIGQVVADKYRLVRLLGQGGMGAVYEAVNTWTTRRVALKFLRAELTAEPGAVARFTQEAKTATAIAHPSIVEVLDMGRDPTDGSLYIVQEFLDGGDLRHFLQGSGGRLPPDEALDIAIPVMGALVAAHGRGVVHRDVKPENIFLLQNTSGRPLPKLIDFGISKVLGSPGAQGMETATGAAMGTPRYMAPEQLRGEKSIDGRADVWAMGVVLYEMLGGRRPYDGGSVFELASQMMTRRPPPLHELCPGLVAEDLAMVIQTAITPDLAVRPASMQAFLDAILACPSLRGSSGEPSLAARHRESIAGGWLMRRPAEEGAVAAAASPDGPAPQQALSLGAGITIPPETPPAPSSSSVPGASEISDGSFLQKVARAPERTPEAPPPERLGHFRIGDQIGRGGMGVVYRAVDEKLGREVAIKLLPQGFEADTERRRRFLSEARAAAAVAHPNLITVFEVDEAEGRVFIAMELVTGSSLRQRLAEQGRLSEPEVVRIGREVASGVAAAHQRGIVHRDLKPDNLMLARSGTVKVLDFGLAKHRISAPDGGSAPASATGAGGLLGTPEYMSPEQATGRAVDARSDVFSLGVILYELGTGQRPFRGDSTLDLVVAISRDPPAPPQVSAGLRTVIDRCLSKDPAQRYAHAGELCEALEALRPETGAAASGAPGVGREAAPERRRLAIVVSLALVAGAAGLVGIRGGLRTGSSATAVTITDQPIPASSVPEARTEYAAGLQSLRDNDWGSAAMHFERAAALDPSVAAHHLRAAMANVSQKTKREAFHRAVALRAQLSPRDREMMEAVEPVLGRLRGDRNEAVARLQAFHRRHPTDVEPLDWIGFLGEGTSEGLAAAQLATRLDPLDGQAWESIGRSEQGLGRLDQARAAYRRCASISSNSIDCWGWLARLEEAEGHCAEFEANALREAPGGTPRDLLGAMVANGRSAEAVQEVLSRWMSTAPPDFKDILRPRHQAWLAFHSGRFAEALPLVDEQERAVDRSTESAEAWHHLTVATQRVGLLLESGDPEGARRAAAAVAARLPALGQREHRVLTDPYLWLMRVGEVDRRTLEASRETWIERHHRARTPAGLIWLSAWAPTAFTASEAREALQALARDRRLAAPRPDIGVDDSLYEADAGRVYLLAGRPAEALPYLRHAVANCNVLYTPRGHALARLDLGRALEATGDRQGACEAYAGVVAMWGEATPRSVSAETARERRTALGCR
jgi:serine/threonine-protein kinase